MQVENLCSRAQLAVGHVSLLLLLVAILVLESVLIDGLPRIRIAPILLLLVVPVLAVSLPLLT